MSYFVPVSLMISILEPGFQVFALTYIEDLKHLAAFDHRFNSRAGDAHASANRELTEKEKVQTD